MTKQELITRISENAKINKTEATKSLDAFITTVTSTLTNGETLTISGLGTFSTATREARTGRNPRTGESINIPKTVVAKFRPAKVLKENLNK